MSYVICRLTDRALMPSLLKLAEALERQQDCWGVWFGDASHLDDAKQELLDQQTERNQVLINRIADGQTAMSRQDFLDAGWELVDQRAVQRREIAKIKRERKARDMRLLKRLLGEDFVAA